MKRFAARRIPKTWFGIKRHRLRGMTLIEVMVVVTILGILTAIAVPSYAEYIRRGNRGEGRAALLASLQQMERFFAANNAYTSDLAGNGFAVRSGEDPARGNYTLAAAACAGTTAAVCVIISATPDPARFTDAECGTLTISTAGVRGITGTGTANTCWQR